MTKTTEELEQMFNQEIDYDVSVNDGKYRVVHFSKGGGHALRYDEKWQDLCGNNLVLTLALELYEERNKHVN